MTEPIATSIHDVAPAACGTPHVDPIVAVGEDGGADRHRLADDPLDRVATAVDERSDPVDDDPARGVGRRLTI